MAKEKKCRLLPLDYIKSIGRYDEELVRELGLSELVKNELKANEKKEIQCLSIKRVGYGRKSNAKVAIIRIVYEAEPRKRVIPLNWIVFI